jgi:two-component sensor histidine kinase
MVMREFQHRVANTLAILSASLRTELATFNVPGLNDALRRHEAQIVAVADLHRFFSHCFENVEIPADHYFQPLCAVLSRSILAPLGLHCEVSVGKTPMCANECEFLGLAVSELVLNAAKYAFSERRSGCVRVEIFEQG